MVAVPLGLSTYERLIAKTPRILMVNMMVEKDPTNLIDGIVRFQRPGLAPFVAVGTGPIRGTFQRAGVFNGDRLIVSGTTLYRVDDMGTTTELGTIPGTNRVVIDASTSKAIIANGSTQPYSTDGSSVTLITMPNGETVSSVVFIKEYFILTVANSQTFYWLAPGDVNPDPLNFAAKENSPDNIVRSVRLLDELWHIGQETTEIWQATGDLSAPFAPVGGRLYERGCADVDSVALLDNTIFWVGNNLIAYRADTQPVRISDHSIEERLRLSGGNNLRGWAFALDGHSYYCLTIGPQGTFVFDVESGLWPQWRTYGRESWQAHLGCQIQGASVTAGDDTTGQLYTLDQTRSDDNGQPLIRELIGGVGVVGPPQPCKSFSIFAATGEAPITGAGSTPLIQFRFSDDNGNTWTSWREITLGLQGQYGIEVAFRRLGLMRAPGRLFHIRMSDPTFLRISYARINEAFAI